MLDCQQDYSKTYEPIFIKLVVQVGHYSGKSPFKFGGDPVLDANTRRKKISLSVTLQVFQILANFSKIKEEFWTKKCRHTNHVVILL